MSKRYRPRNGLKLNRLKGANQTDGPSADINSIIAQFKKTGTMPSVPRRNPLYGDFTFGDDIHEVREAIFEAEDRFSELPSAVRAAAQNDWGQFLKMFNDPEQQKILEEAGLKITDTPIPNNSPPPTSEPINDETPTPTTTPTSNES